MKNIIMALTISCCVYALTAYAQDAAIDTVESGGNNADTPADIVQSEDGDSLDVSRSDSLDIKKLDSFDDFDSDEDLEIADAPPADTAAAVQKLGGVKRGYERGRQVKLAIVMMVFLIFALGTSQSFNPR